MQSMWVKFKQTTELKMTSRDKWLASVTSSLPERDYPTQYSEALLQPNTFLSEVEASPQLMRQTEVE